MCLRCIFVLKFYKLKKFYIFNLQQNVSYFQETFIALKNIYWDLVLGTVYVPVPNKDKISTLRQLIAHTRRMIAQVII